MTIQAAHTWMYEPARTQYKEAALTTHKRSDDVIELRLEGKTGERFTVLLGTHEARMLLQHLASMLGSEDPQKP